MECPKSIISAASLDMMERFYFWKAAGGGSLLNERAKTADAILYLNEQWEKEQQDGKI